MLSSQKAPFELSSMIQKTPAAFSLGDYLLYSDTFPNNPNKDIDDELCLSEFMDLKPEQMYSFCTTRKQSQGKTERHAGISSFQYISITWKLANMLSLSPQQISHTESKSYKCYVCKLLSSLEENEKIETKHKTWWESLGTIEKIRQHPREFLSFGIFSIFTFTLNLVFLGLAYNRIVIAPDFAFLFLLTSGVFWIMTQIKSKPRE